MTITLNASTASGLVVTPDNSGQIAFQNNGTTELTVNAFGIGLGTAVPSSGTGITFPAVQDPSSNANTLDDYEEGTWTPTGNGITYSNALGSYIKIGRLVMATFNVTFPSTSNTSGAQIRSLPFTIFNGGGPYQSGAYVACTDSSTAKNTNFTANVGTAILIFRDTANADVANSSFSTKFIQGTAMYYADA